MTLYWSIRRELWENRFVLIAPLIVTAVVLFATFVSIATSPRRVRAAEPARQSAVLAKPFRMAPAPIMLASFIVGLFYAIDSLYGERRDRSILFWKSMPVSDRTTVLAKAAIPLAVLPLFAFALSAATQLGLAAASTPVLLANRINPSILWRELQVSQGVPIMLYGLMVHTLWFAPIYGWFTLVSAWARRAPLLWAVLPLVPLAAFERMGLTSLGIMRFMQYRISGAMTEAFGNMRRFSGFSQLTPVSFITSSGLWLGLLFAAACYVAATYLRRMREETLV